MVNTSITGGAELPRTGNRGIEHDGTTWQHRPVDAFVQRLINTSQRNTEHFACAQPVSLAARRLVASPIISNACMTA
jgi:hypothetical protein